MSLVLIGGGEISKGELKEIDLEIIKRGNGRNKLVLFFPTAAEDSLEYSKIFEKYYSSLGCKNVRTIQILKENFDSDKLRELLKNTGIIYLGGGDTALLIESMEKYEVKDILAEAFEMGILIAGMSAGAIALGDVTYPNKKNKEHFMEAWGLIGGYVIDAHFSEQNRAHNLLSLTKFNKIGLGIDEKTALIIEGDRATVFGDNNVFLVGKSKKIFKSGDSFIL